MIRHRTAEEVRRYNWFKIIVLIILALLLLLLSLARCDSPTAVSETPATAVPATAAAASEAPATATPADSGTNDTTTAQPATVAAVVLAVPQLTEPALSDVLTVGSAIELVGTGTPGTSVRLLINGQPIETVPVDDDGNWRYTYTPEQAGELDLILEAVDENGQAGVSSEAMVLTVAEPEPEIVAPTLDPMEGDVAVGAYELTGTGTPGSMVAIIIAGESVGTAEVDEAGNWSYVADFAERGSYDIAVQALDGNGEVVAEAGMVTLMVAVPVVAPTLDLPTGEDVTAVGPVELVGTGTPGSIVEVDIDGEVRGTAEVDEAGNWSYMADFAEAGNYLVTVRGLDANGEVVAEAKPVSLSVTAGSDLLAVASEQGMLTSLLMAVDSAMLTETLRSEGPYTFLAPTDDAFTALPEGAWEALQNDEEALLRLLQYHLIDGRIDMATAVAEGTLTTTAGDMVSVVASEDGDIQIDGVSVLTPDIEADNGLLHVLDGVLLPPSEIEPPVIDESGVPTFEGPLLTIVGTAEPGTRLVVVVNGETFGSTTVEADGTWLVADNIEDGEHVIVAYTLNEDGLPLARSGAVVLISPAP